ncbi:MAG: ATPase [Mediterranea sp.]|jgi:N-acetylglucosamine kinase-like BadF-type ATPase|nr:ATPase [Mediterranea sp.]
MILIADSGSTKTDWGIVEHGRLIRLIQTKGMNPYFQSEEEIGNEITDILLPQLETNTFDTVYFYGAGCTAEETPIVTKIISKRIKVTNTIEVCTDMLAAARALCGRKAGIVCILGTGSNSCYYNGKEIINNIPPLGYILGDEGSGAVLGKLLVGDLLKNQLTTELKEKFLKQYKLTLGELIEHVYRQPFPNRFLASLSPFLAENIHEPPVYALVLNSFKAFLKRNVMQYDYRNNKVHFIGSVAHYYKEVLMEAVNEMGVQIGGIMRSPMEGLVEFHTEKI